MNRYFITLTCLVCFWGAQSQDTLRVMQYNLLNYGNFTDYCPSFVNPVDDKDGYLRTIADYVRPDIFSVNEMVQWPDYHERVLTNVFNREGVTKYARITVPNNAGSDLVNMIYYNTDKVLFHSSRVAQSLTRDIDVVKFYYNGTGLTSGDTIFFHCVVAHLKAGDGTANATERTAMVLNAMNYLQTNYQAGNYLFMGDLNLYSPTEGAFVALTQSFGPSWIFHDPAGRVGEWHANSLFSDVHTQSTHTDGGCWASGGMDDRFDFILASNSVMDGSRGIRYVNSSYKALGQDGNHYNKALTDAPALPLPTDLVNALYKNSDHLPVMLNLKVDQTMGLATSPVIETFSVVSPASGSVQIMGHAAKSSQVEIGLTNMAGSRVYCRSIAMAHGPFSLQIPVNQLPEGLYLVTLTASSGQWIARKVLVK